MVRALLCVVATSLPRYPLFIWECDAALPFSYGEATPVHRFVGDSMPVHRFGGDSLYHRGLCAWYLLLCAREVGPLFNRDSSRSMTVVPYRLGAWYLLLCTREAGPLFIRDSIPVFDRCTI
jgi:hypothetical protein